MLSRRTLLSGAAGTAAISTPAITVAAIPTPRQAAGPFFPDVLPPESDADLTQIGSGAAAQGEVIEVAGRVLGLDGRPISGAAVQLWQANTFGRYANTRDRSSAPLDPNFQGYGVAMSDAEGFYRFRTIRPGLYTGRTRHLHFAAQGPGFEVFTTQMYFEGEPDNGADFLYRSLGDRAGALTTRFALDAERGVPVGTFDFVVDGRG